MNDDLRSHLEFFAELGVDGLRLEPEWRSREKRRDTVPRPGESLEIGAAIQLASLRANGLPGRNGVARALGAQVPALLLRGPILHNTH